MNLYTQSLENATVTLTNGGAGSNAAILSYRDLRIYGLNVGSGTTTVTVHIDFGAAIDIDYFLMFNLTTSGEVGYTWSYSDNDSDWSDIENDSTTFTNANIMLTTTTETHRYWRVVFDRSGGASTLSLSGIFTGEVYSSPNNYKYNNNRGTQLRTEIANDIYGYPYGQALNDSKKYIWEVVFNMTKAQVAALEDQLEIVQYNCKPFFVYDALIDTNYHLVKYPDNQLKANNLSYEFYEVPLTLIEL